MKYIFLIVLCFMILGIHKNLTTITSCANEVGVNVPIDDELRKVLRLVE